MLKRQGDRDMLLV